MYKFIKKYSDFILNETLKTIDLNKAYKDIKLELGLMNKFNYKLSIYESKLNLNIFDLNKLENIGLIIDYIDSLFIDRYGYFPSNMEILYLGKNNKILPYDEDFIIKNYLNIKDIKITYEPKYDKIEKLPNKLYHISIQEYKDKINKNGLIPKSKSKLSKHLDRIYVCSDINDCYKLILKMKLIYSDDKFKNHNTKWIIYEIDTNNLDISLYKDPNYNGGYYIVENISPNNLKIIDKE